MAAAQRPVVLVPLEPPPAAQRRGREARLPLEGEKPNRYHLPRGLESDSPVGYRVRPALTAEEAAEAAALFDLAPPVAFVAGAPPPTEGELFDECALGVLSSRQSTNFRGFRQTTLGPGQSTAAAALLRRLAGRESPVCDGATHTHLVLGRRYTTPFTMLLTFVGHKPVQSLLSVPQRIWAKRTQGATDIPTIGYLPHLHTGILAENIERAAIVASAGARAASVLMAPFAGPAVRATNAELIRALEDMAGLTAQDRRAGWGLQLVAQVGALPTPVPLRPATARKLGAALLSLRSERIQPGVNMEERAPATYQTRQDMVVPEALVTNAGRAGFNAMARWLGLPRDQAKALLLTERVDVLTEGGKGRLRQIRGELGDITDRVVADLPLWADLPTGRALSRNAARGRKAFALAGQRIYIGGLDADAVERAGIDRLAAVRAAGAAAARSALVCELSGLIGIPEGCDMLAGCCLMAGPVNQNDIGKQYYGMPDLLAGAHPGRQPISLLVWTLKAKTVADPIGNEEQLLSARRKGALVDLRAGPAEVVTVVGSDGRHRPLRAGQTVPERAFSELDNFARTTDGQDIPGNVGRPGADRDTALW